MKKYIQQILSITLISLSANIHSQVTTTITGMTYLSGGAINNCGNIAFGTNNTEQFNLG